MLLKLFQLFILSIYCCVCLGNTVDLTPQEIQTIRVLKATLFLENKKEAVYLDRHEYIYERTEEGYLKLTSSSYPGLDDPIVGDKYHHYLIKLDGKKSGKIEIYNNCKKVDFIEIGQWEDVSPLFTSSTIFEDGQWIYNEEGMPIELRYGLKYKRSGKKKIFSNTTFIIKYNESGKLSEVEKNVIVYKKSKSAKNLKEDYTKVEYKFAYQETVGEDVYQFVNNTYQKKKVEVSSETRTTISLEGNKTRYQSIETITKKKNKTEMISLNERQYDQEWKLLGQRIENENSIVTLVYEYDVHSRFIRTIDESRQNKDGSYTWTKSTTNAYNDDNLLKTQTIIEEKDHTFADKYIVEYDYSEVKENITLSPCQQKEKSIVKHYDADDKLYKEIVGNKFRIKEGGSWSEWRPFTG